jgi:4-amino-4-deoxy-L-arabinose transferase-like glycosyltransferase
LGVFSVWGFYYVFAKVFDKRTGLIASFLYAVSFYTIFNDREVVPTMPVIAWSVWFFYALNLLLKGKQKVAYLILGILIGLIWHLNMTLVLLVPLIVVAQLLSKKKVELKSVFFGVIIALVFSLPLIAFELRHGFPQTRALFLSLTTDQHDIISGADKLRRVIHLASKNISGFVWGDLNWMKYETLTILLLILFVVLVIKKVVSRNQAILMSLWLLIYIAFFSVYSKILSEYYLNGMGIFFMAIIVLGISHLVSNKKYKKLGLVLLAAFTVINLYRFFSLVVNRSGYVERKATVSEIKRDAAEKDFPCVSVSYITKPGYEFGYRYFYWQEDMHVNHPDSNSPVYTIVFPLRKDVEVDKVFGAIGLIYPDYSRYTKEEILESCSGENSNETDSMWGFTN